MRYQQTSPILGSLSASRTVLFFLGRRSGCPSPGRNRTWTPDDKAHDGVDLVQHLAKHCFDGANEWAEIARI